MKKMKIAAILIGAMFVGLATTSVTGVELGTEISVTIDKFIGLVSPSITAQEEESIALGVDVNESCPDRNVANYSYVVNDKITINIGYTDLSNREAFILPRLMFYRVAAMRDFADRDDGKGKLLDKLFPIKVGFGQVGVVNTTGGKPRAEYINISVRYQITNETYNQSIESSETFTLRIFTMGFLPGNVNGIGFLDGQIPIVDYKQVNLTVNYYEKSYIGLEP